MDVLFFVPARPPLPHNTAAEGELQAAKQNKKRESYWRLPFDFIIRLWDVFKLCSSDSFYNPT